MQKQSRFDALKLSKNKDKSSNPAIVALRGMINPHVLGLKDDGIPKHQFKKNSEIFKRNTHRFLPKIPNYVFNKHFSNEETGYYVSKSWKQQLIMLDFDVSKSLGIGTSEDANKAVEVLHDLLGDFYHEKSTGGIGQQGFIRVFCDPRSDYCYIAENDGYRPATDEEMEKQTRKDLLEFGAVIDEYVKNLGINIEKFEIKGYCDIIEKKNYYVSDINRGALAKMPREIIDDNCLKEFNNTLEITIQELNNITQKIKKKLQLPQKIKKKYDGASSGDYKITEDYLPLLNSCRDFVRASYFDTVNCGTFLKKKVVEEDRAVYLFIVEFLKSKGSKETSCKTVSAIWDYLKRIGWTDRSYNSSRLCVVRNEFINRKMFNGDHIFVVPDSLNSDGEILSGKACRYEPIDGVSAALKDLSSLGKVTMFAVHSIIAKIQFSGYAQYPRRAHSPPWVALNAA